MLASNIKAIKKNRGLTNKELASLSGVPLNTLSKILCGMTTNPTVNTLTALADALDCKIWEFFDEGQGNGPHFSRDERELIDVYRELQPAGRELARRHMKDLAEYQSVLLKGQSTAYTVSLPLYTLPTAADGGCFLDADTYEMTDFPYGDVPDRTNFAVQVRGDAMAPAFADGNVVFVHQTRYLDDGDVGVFVLNGEGCIRELSKGDGQVYLIARNSDVPPITVNPGDDLRVVGQVLK